MKEIGVLAAKEYYQPLVHAFGITSRVPLTQSIMNQTLKYLMNSHALFRMCIKRNEDGAKWFRKMDAEVLNNIQVKIRDDTDWKIAADEKREGNVFDFENGPLWKCIFLPNATMNNTLTENLSQHNCVVIFIQDHVINDGTGLVQMTKKFMSILNQLLDEKEVDIPLSPPALPMEYFLNQKYPMSGLQKCLILLLHTLLSFKITASSLVWMINKFVIKQVRLKEGKCTKTVRSHLQMKSKKETMNLVQACRNNGCTVQGAIQAASNVALLHILRTMGRKLPHNINTLVSIDMRRRLLDDSAEFVQGTHQGGLQVGIDIEEEILSLDPKQLWRFAQQSTNALHAQIKEKRYLKNSQMYVPPSFAERHFSLLMKLFTMRQPLLLLVSSLGRFTVSESDTTIAKPNGFHLKFAGTKREEFFTTYAVTLDGQLSIAHSYYPQVISECLKIEYLDKFEDIMKVMIGDGL